MKIRFPAHLKVAAAVVSLFYAQVRAAETDLVANGSFENYNVEIDRFAGWATSNNGAICAGINEGASAAEGGNYVFLCVNELWQDLQTMPGGSYRLRFALNGFAFEIPTDNVVRVFWGDQVVGLVTNSLRVPMSHYTWVWTNIYVHADSSFTRLRFERAGANPSLDAISVISLEEPAGLASPLVSQSAFVGAKVEFVAKPTGTAPLFCQWSKNGMPLPGGTNTILALTNATIADAGDYTVSVSNQFGLKFSNIATLLVQPIPEIPLILSQPKSQDAVAGYGLTFTVAAIGKAPMSYQWRKNSNNVAAGTNAALSFFSVAPTDAGEFTVVVSNLHGSVISIPATLTVSNALGGGGYVEFSNRFPTNSVNARVFDVDGVTALSGAEWLVQLYAGTRASDLHAIGQTTNFLTDSFAGYFNPVGQNPLAVPDVSGGSQAYIQLRVWESSGGGNFEEARVRGFKYGRSETVAVITSAQAFDPAGLRDLPPFSVRTGDPLYASARIEAGSLLPDGRQEWLVTGEVGGIYNVESRDGFAPWQPLMLLTNVTGTISFVDAQSPPESVRMYRARILE